MEAEEPVGEATPRHIPNDVMIAVAVRDGGKCRYCGADSGLHFDHVIPWSKGGLNTVKNIQLLCGPCNLNKAASVLPIVSSVTKSEGNASSEVHAIFGNVEVTVNDINQAITWLLDTVGGHETFTTAMESCNNPLADWAKNGYPGLKTWNSPKPPQKPQIADYLRQALVVIQDVGNLGGPT